MANNVTGKVSRLFTRSIGTSIRLHVPSGTVLPLDGYFNLRLTHPNYNALYSLALAAAVNGYDLKVRASAEINPAEEADVSYLVVNWPA
jgi:hypothetical protein